MTTEEKIKGLEHLLRKCPDVITALEASRLIHVSKNAIHAANARLAKREAGESVK